MSFFLFLQLPIIIEEGDVSPTPSPHPVQEAEEAAAEVADEVADDGEPVPAADDGPTQDGPQGRPGTG